MPDPRERLTDRSPEVPALRCALHEQRLEAWSHFVGVLGDRDQRVRRWNVTEATCFAARMQLGVVLALRELAA